MRQRMAVFVHLCWQADGQSDTLALSITENMVGLILFNKAPLWATLISIQHV